MNIDYIRHRKNLIYNQIYTGRKYLKDIPQNIKLDEFEAKILCQHSYELVNSLNKFNTNINNIFTKFPNNSPNSTNGSSSNGINVSNGSANGNDHATVANLLIAEFKHIYGESNEFNNISKKIKIDVKNKHPNHNNSNNNSTNKFPNDVSDYSSNNGHINNANIGVNGGGNIQTVEGFCWADLDCWKNEVVDALMAPINAVRDTISNVIGSIKNAISSIFDTITEVVNNVLSKFEDLINSIKNIANGVMYVVKDIFNDLFGIVIKVFEILWNVAKSLVELIKSVAVFTQWFFTRALINIYKYPAVTIVFAILIFYLSEKFILFLTNTSVSFVPQMVVTVGIMFALLDNDTILENLDYLLSYFFYNIVLNQLSLKILGLTEGILIDRINDIYNAKTIPDRYSAILVANIALVEYFVNNPITVIIFMVTILVLIKLLLFDMPGFLMSSSAIKYTQKQWEKFKW